MRIQRLWQLVILLILSFCAISDSAEAQVKVTFSDRMADTLDRNGIGARTAQKRLNEDFNRGLKELGKTNPAAKDLYESGQTIRIICGKGKEATEQNIDLGPAPAETHGDFDENGKPKKGGTAIVAMKCSRVRLLGLDKEFIDIDPRSTGFKILIHELLHATNEARKHSEDSQQVYIQFVDDFMAALERVKSAERRNSKRDRRAGGSRRNRNGQKPDRRRKTDLRQASVPESSSEQQTVGFASGTRVSLDFNLSAIGGTGQVDPTFGNPLSASNSTTEFSVGADVRLPFAQLSEGVTVVGGAWAKVFPEGDKTIAVLERHPTPGLDTRVLQNQLAFIFLYAGLQIQNIGQQLGNGSLCTAGALLCDAAFTLFFGPRIQINETILETDESGGGGAQERFDNANAALGFTVGADLDFPIATSGPLQTFLRFGAAIDFTPETTVSGRSGLGFDYEGRIKGNVDGRFFVGFGVELPAGAYASDRRLKHNVKLLGEHASGLKLYRYRYVWGGPEWIGVMAQEVAMVRSDAVITSGDYLAVDYAKLGIRPIVVVP